MKAIIILWVSALASLYLLFFAGYKLDSHQWFYFPTMFIVCCLMVILSIAGYLAFMERNKGKGE